MSFLKTAVIISILIIFIIFSGCLDEEPVIIRDPTPTPTPTQNSTVLAAGVTATPIVIITDVTVTIVTPTSAPTPRSMDVSDGESLPWCVIKSECDQGIRSYKTEMCISAQQIPELVMGYYCGTSPIQTPNESVTRAPRTEQEQKAFDDA